MATAHAPVTSRGTVYGFEIHSERTFHSLRTGTGSPLEIVQAPPTFSDPGELIAHLKSRHFEARVHEHDDGSFRLWVKYFGWFSIDPKGGRIAIPQNDNPIVLEEVLWGVPALLCFLHRGDLSLHASAVEIDGQAVIFAAPRAHGKSTLAAGFSGRGYRVLAEDLTCIRLGAVPAVIPGPATIRLRNDVGSEYSVPHAKVLEGANDRVRFALAPAERGTCEPVPIAALMFLRPAETEVSFDRVEPALSLPDLWRFSFRLSAGHKAACFERIADVAAHVPIWNLHRPLRLDALDATVDGVLAQLDREALKRG